MGNRIKTVALLATLTALVMTVGYTLGGKGGLVFAFLFTGVMNLVSYWWSDKIILRLYGAKPVTSEQEPELYQIVEELAHQNRMPMPKVYLIPEQTPNAFATGRSPEHAAVAVTKGLLGLLDARELKGVLGHELGHVKNRDTLISTIAATFAGALSMIGEMAMWGALSGRQSDDEDRHPLVGLIGIIVAPLAGAIIQSAISRSREFLADEAGAQTTGDPLSLASALEKIEAHGHRIPLRHGSPATAHLFIINPFKGASLLKLFSTHPPTAERVKRLRAMSGSAYRMGGVFSY